MKKRSLFSTIAIMILALVMVFAFVACDGANDDDPANAKGEKVTAEQWESAFDFSAVTNSTYTTIGNFKDDEDEYTVTTILEYDGDKGHYKSTMQYTDEDGVAQEYVHEYYMTQVNGKVYEYTYNEEDEKWDRVETDYGEWSYGGSFGSDFAYEKFTYDENKKGYVAELESYGESYSVLVKIIKGKVAYIEQSGEEGKTTTTITKINGTSVTLPTVAED